jgi:hypothetical protein
VQYGGEEEWKEAWKIYKTSKNPEQIHASISGIGATNNEECLQKTFQMILDEKEVKGQVRLGLK